ncbi:MAG: hypothetical protein ABJC54_04770, partial [Qipengyuania citrea]
RYQAALHPETSGGGPIGRVFEHGKHSSQAIRCPGIALLLTAPHFRKKGGAGGLNTAPARSNCEFDTTPISDRYFIDDRSSRRRR